MKTTVKFGTDGWRALIAKDYTYESVSFVAKAVADVMKKELPDRKIMVIGYDRRFLSNTFAEVAAATYAKEGYEVWIGEQFFPTPTIAWCAKNKPGVVGATMITASHNPPTWNGFKFKETFGGSARPALTEKFENRIVELQKSGFEAVAHEEFHALFEQGKIKHFNPMAEYLEAVKEHIDLDLIRGLGAKVGIDAMHGAASGHYANFLRSLGIEVEEIHAEENPGFRGVAPEPIGKNLPELCQLVKDHKLACGLAPDGDGDRLGAVDEDGNPFTTQMILSVAYWHMLKHRGKSWSISRSASTTRMVDLIAEKAGKQCIETPVGFKHIAEEMLAGKADIGGEESGGIGMMDHIPDRDGFLTGLLLLEVMAKTGKRLRAVYEDLCKEYRPYQFVRLDLKLEENQAKKAMEKLTKNPPSEWDGREVDVLSTLDGFKFYLKDGSWLLIRKSGTEPIFRLYAETESLEASESMVQAARNFVENG